MAEKNKKFSSNKISSSPKTTINTESLASWSRNENSGNAGDFKNPKIHPADARNIAIIVTPELTKSNIGKTAYSDRKGDKYKGPQTKISKLVYKPQQIPTKAIIRSVHSFTSTFERKMHAINELKDENESLNKNVNRRESNLSGGSTNVPNDTQTPKEEITTTTLFVGRNSHPRRVSRICDSTEIKSIFDWGLPTDDYSPRRNNSSFTSLKAAETNYRNIDSRINEKSTLVPFADTDYPLSTDNNIRIKEIEEKFGEQSAFESRILEYPLGTDNDEKSNKFLELIKENEPEKIAIIERYSKTEIAMNIPLEKKPSLHETEEKQTDLKTVKSSIISNLENNVNAVISPQRKPSVNTGAQNTKKKETNANDKMQKNMKKGTSKEEIKRRLEELRKNQLKIVSRNIKKARKRAATETINHEVHVVKSDTKLETVPNKTSDGIKNKESVEVHAPKSAKAGIFIPESAKLLDNTKSGPKSLVKVKEKLNVDSEKILKTKHSARSTSRSPSRSTQRSPSRSSPRSSFTSKNEKLSDRIKFGNRFPKAAGILRKTDTETELPSKSNENNIANADSRVIMNEMQKIVNTLDSVSIGENEKENIKTIQNKNIKIDNKNINGTTKLEPVDDFKLKIPDVKLQTKVSTNEQSVQAPITPESLPPRREEVLHMLRPSPVQVYPYNFIVAVRKKLEAVTNPLLIKNHEEPKLETINKIKECLVSHQKENKYSNMEGKATRVKDPNVVFSQETDHSPCSSNVLSAKENIQSSVASYTPVFSNDTNDTKSYKSNTEDKSVKSRPRSKSETSSKTISELPHSNFSSISIHVPDSHTTSEVSSLHSEVIKHSSRAKKEQSAITSQQQPTSSEMTYTNKAHLEERNDDDTTVSSSVFSSPEKRALKQETDKKLEAIDDNTFHLDIGPLSIGKINNDNKILEIESTLTTNEGNENLLEVPKTRLKLKEKILHKSKNTDDNGHNNTQINVNKFVEDFHKSLSGVIEENKRLKSLVETSKKEDTSQRENIKGDSSKILIAKKSNQSLNVGEVDYSSDFEEILTSKRNGTGGGSSNKSEMAIIESSINGDIKNSKIATSNKTDNTSEHKEEGFTATSSKSSPSNAAHNACATQENNLKGTIFKENSQSQNYSSSLMTRHHEVTSSNEISGSNEINTQQYSSERSSPKMMKHPLGSDVSDSEIPGRREKSSNASTMKSSSKSSIKSAIMEESSNHFSGKSSTKSAIVEEGLKHFSENSSIENKEIVLKNWIRKSNENFSKTQYSRDYLESSEYHDNNINSEMQDRVHFKENMLKYVNSSRGDFNTNVPFRNDFILENSRKKKHLSSSKERKSEFVFENSMESAPPAYPAKDTLKYSNAVDTSSTGTGMFTIFDQSDVELSTTSRNDSVSESSINYSSIGWYEQLLQKENSKSKHLTALLKIREKSLLDRARAQVMLLEMQKQKYKTKGLTAEVSATKKKQRAILLKMQRKKEEIRRWLQCQENNRKKEKSEHIDELRSQFLRRNLFSENNRHMPEIVLRRNSLPNEMKPTVTVDKSRKIVKGYELRGSHSLERFLEERENELKRRRAQVEHLLEWHQRLDKEEEDISELEKKLVGQSAKKNTKPENDKYQKRINNIDKGLKELRDVPSSSTTEESIKSESTCKSKYYRVKGRELNRLWRRLIRRKEEKFKSDKEYSINKEDVELLYEEAKLEVLRGFGKENGLNILDESEINILEENEKTIKFPSLRKNVQIQTSIRSEESSPEEIESELTLQPSSNNTGTVRNTEYSENKNNSSSKTISGSDYKISINDNFNVEKDSSLNQIIKSLSDSEISTKSSRRNEIRPINSIISSDGSFPSSLNKIEKENLDKLSHNAVQNKIDDISLNHREIIENISIKKSASNHEKEIELLFEDKNNEPRTNHVPLKTASSSETEKFDTIAEVSSLSHDESISNFIKDESSTILSQKDNEKFTASPKGSQENTNSSTRNSVIISTLSIHLNNESNENGTHLNESSTPEENSFPTYKSSKENDKRELPDLPKTNEEKFGNIFNFTSISTNKENKEYAGRLQSVGNEINESTFIENVISIPKFEELLDTSASERSSQTLDTFSSDSEIKLSSKHEDDKRRNLAEEVVSPSELKKRLIDIDHSLKDLSDSFECALSPKKSVSPVSSNISISEGKENNLPNGNDFSNATSASSSSPSIVNVVHHESSPPSPVSDIPFVKDEDSSKRPNQILQQQQQILNENDIKHLEHAVPYVFLREIPNKPPPPYVPPAHGSPMTTIFPSEERIKDITFRRVKELYQEVFLPEIAENELENISCNKNPSILDENITNIYERIILDICKEWMREFKTTYNPNPELYKNRLTLFNPPDRLQCFQEAVYKDVRKFLGMDRKNNMKNNAPFISTQVSWYNRRKRDHINDILIQELYEEEQKWTTFDLEEEEVRETVIDEIFSDVLNEVLNDVLSAHKV